MVCRIALLLVGFFLLAGIYPTLAQDSSQTASPVADRPPIRVALVERAEHVTYLDLGEPGFSVGDMIVWGPDPLYDAENVIDTGGTTQGSCISFTAASDCILTETIVFPTGTLELQGIQPGDPVESVRTIVGGSGSYLGARGTVRVQPSADLSTWTKTFEIWI